MNERIKEIAKQCGAIFVESSADYFGERHPASILTDKVDLQKFAELIALECSKIIDPTEADVSLLEECSLYKAILKIQEHFGVEE